MTLPLYQEIQNAIYYGGAVAAEILSAPHQHFRPAAVGLDGGGLDSGGTLDPSTGPALDPANRILPDLPFIADRTPGNFGFKSPSGYGKATWQALVDGSKVQVGDYLVGDSGTWFIAAMQRLPPILVVQCNGVLSLKRRAGVSGFGDPSEYSSDTERAIFTSWPCSMLTKSRGEAGATQLPTDVKSPWIEVLLPDVPGIQIEFADVLTDETGTRYTVSSTEHTDLGWRLLVAESKT